ncbi:26S Proteasome non-ATPase regulatory subunit 13 like protein [Aduncisulcus paluster]|uniref:26S Proteasome non-ATPase regulatory subunit 13 like protein n=1 Tax=Aduncisulcus paluster TaxID=2918883 RepID=A0ABQ5K484_9EUKA|nr:26S Proteasome non-ATPase regulatory subunit 13 like protein [Aduncisulcus paluster]
MEKLKEFAGKRYWHQYSVELNRLYNNLEFRREVNLLDFFLSSVTPYIKNIAPLNTAMYAFVAILEDIPLETHKSFIEDVFYSLRETKDENAALLGRCLVLHFLLVSSGAPLSVIGKHLFQLSKIISSSAPPLLNCALMYCITIFHKKCEHYDGFYRSLIEFWGYARKAGIALDDKLILSFAIDGAKSLMLSTSVWDISPFLEHPLAHSISASKDYAFLLHLLSVIKDGNVILFDEWMGNKDNLVKFESNIALHVLASKQREMREKTSIFGLLTLFLKREGMSRRASFDEIASLCGISRKDVFELVMKANESGVIDVEIEWSEARGEDIVCLKKTAARVLSRKEIGMLLKKYDRLDDHVSDAIRMLEGIVGV